MQNARTLETWLSLDRVIKMLKEPPDAGFRPRVADDVARSQISGVSRGNHKDVVNDAAAAVLSLLLVCHSHIFYQAGRIHGSTVAEGGMDSWFCPAEVAFSLQRAEACKPGFRSQGAQPRKARSQVRYLQARATPYFYDGMHRFDRKEVS